MSIFNRKTKQKESTDFLLEKISEAANLKRSGEFAKSNEIYIELNKQFPQNSVLLKSWAKTLVSLGYSRQALAKHRQAYEYRHKCQIDSMQNIEEIYQYNAEMILTRFSNPRQFERYLEVVSGSALKNPKGIRTVQELDDYISYITLKNNNDRINDRISFAASEGTPSFSPQMDKLFSLYSKIIEIKDVTQSIKQYTNLLEKVPRFASARYNLAQAIERSGDPDTALQQLHIARKYNPTDVSIFIEVGKIYLHLENAQDAIKAQKHTLKVLNLSNFAGDFSFPAWLAMINLGMAYRMLQEFEESLTWFEEALTFIQVARDKALTVHAWDSELMATYYELAFLHQTMGNSTKCIEISLQGLQIDGGMQADYNFQDYKASILFVLGKEYLRLKNWEKAVFYLEQSIKILPNNPSISLYHHYYNLALNRVSMN